MLKTRIWQRVRTDHGYRGRFIHSICIFWAFLGAGLGIGIMGPTFPDLRQITKQNLETGSWLYTSGSIGYLVGALLGGVLYARFNRLLLLGAATAVAGLSTVVKPWCEWFPLMTLVGAFGTFSFGVLDIGGNAEMVSIWQGEEGSIYMQALHFFLSIGGIISPLLANPFLAPRTCVPFTAGNNSGGPTFNKPMTVTDDNKTIFSAGCKQTYGKTSIYIAYLISGVIIFSGCIPFLVLYLQSDRKNSNVDDADRKDTEQRPAKMPLKIKTLLMFLLCSLLGIFTAIEDSFIGYLMTFCLRYYHWSKDYGSYASSVHWMAFSVGRFFGMFSARMFSSGCLLFTHLTFNLISITGLLVGSITQNQTLSWISIPLTGLSMSVVFPCIFTWTETRFMRVTGMVASLFMASGGGIRIVTPLVFGYMMDNYSPVWFVYLLLGEAVLCLLLFLAIQMTGRLCLDQQTVDGDEGMSLLSGQEKDTS